MSVATWPTPWREVTDPEEALRLVAELRREVPEGHAMHGRAAYAFARREDCDDVLYAFEDGAVAQVHLTWSGETNPWFPQVQIFKNADVWRDQLSGE